MKTVTVEKCMVPQCQRGGTHSRGLCNTHYVAAARIVEQKKTTWEKLEKEGKVHPSKKIHRATIQDYFLGDK